MIALGDLIKAGDDVIRASNTMMLTLAGELPLTKMSIEAAIRRALDARNQWDNALRALQSMEAQGAKGDG